MKKKVMLRLLAIINPHTVPVVRRCNKKTLQAVLFHEAMHQSFQRSRRYAAWRAARSLERALTEE